MILISCIIYIFTNGHVIEVIEVQLHGRVCSRNHLKTNMAAWEALDADGRYYYFHNCFYSYKCRISDYILY